ncbi:MAG: hypothetical protein WBG58_17105 [Ignavibacteriaceae bacterium]|jgi:hypothetical protein
MKKLLILIIAFIFISCEDSETIYKYPDGISAPNKIIASAGCGNIFIYQFLDSLKALTVTMDGEKLSLTQKRQAIELDVSNPNISVVLEISGNDPDSIYFNYCNDVAFINMDTTTKYNATSGTLYFSVSEDNPIKDPSRQNLYFVTIKIQNLHLMNQENNDEIIIDEVVFWDVQVGWLPG